MSFRQDVRSKFSAVWTSIHNLHRTIADSRKQIGSYILPLQTKICNLEKVQCEVTIKINDLKNQIANFKQEICGLKTEHQYVYSDNIDPGLYMFVCKLCGDLTIIPEGELTPIQRKALQALGVLENESAKKCSD